MLLAAAGVFGNASAGVVTYTERAIWQTAVYSITTIDFGVAVPPPGGSYSTYSSPPGVTVDGVTFTNVISGASVYVISDTYCCQTYDRGYVTLETTGGLTVALPAGTTAAGFNLFSVENGNLSGTNNDTYQISINGQNFTVTTLAWPSVVFFGFVSSTPIASITITPVAFLGQPNISDFSFALNAGLPPEGVPIGSLDTPANDTTNVAGAVAVTGWALSSVGIRTIGIWRDPVNAEAVSPNGLVFVGNATQIPGSRPDVAKAFPGYPDNNYGWGLQVLSNELPGTNGLALGNGVYEFHAIAVDNDGFSEEIGHATIFVNNASSVLPFGAIDTPTQGGAASGTAFVNFGWALTPLPASIATNGSTITVYIDNVAVGHPVYNNYRSDIATLFPGLANSNGAIGYFRIDTTKYSNGLHTISWGVRDSAGHANGIGSRYFIVQN